MFGSKSRDWSKDFKNEETLDSYRKEFELMDNYLSPWHPETILDIGTAYAQVPEMFQRKYNSQLYLLDGDASSNKPNQVRDIGYGESSNFQFYTNKMKLIEDYDRRGLKYNFIDAQRIQIPNINFDLIMSCTSCGFHYPLNTYSNLISAYSNTQTKIIIDLRKATLKDQLEKFEIKFEIVDILRDQGKSVKALIKLQ